MSPVRFKVVVFSPWTEPLPGEETEAGNLWLVSRSERCCSVQNPILEMIANTFREIPGIWHVFRSSRTVHLIFTIERPVCRIQQHVEVQLCGCNHLYTAHLTLPFNVVCKKRKKALYSQESVCLQNKSFNVTCATFKSSIWIFFFLSCRFQVQS